MPDPGLYVYYESGPGGRAHQQPAVQVRALAGATAADAAELRAAPLWDPRAPQGRPLLRPAAAASLLRRSLVKTARRAARSARGAGLRRAGGTNGGRALSRPAARRICFDHMRAPVLPGYAIAQRACALRARAYAAAERASRHVDLRYTSDAYAGRPARVHRLVPQVQPPAAGGRV